MTRDRASCSVEPAHQTRGPVGALESPVAFSGFYFRNSQCSNLAHGCLCSRVPSPLCPFLLKTLKFS